MSDFTKSFAVTIPANGNVNSPVMIATPLGDADVQQIYLTFAPGCAGLVGVAIYAGGSPAYPNDQGRYFVFDDFTLIQDVSNQITTGQWSIVGYNTDVFDHTVQVIYQANYVAASPGTFATGPVSV